MSVTAKCWPFLVGMIAAIPAAGQATQQPGTVVNAPAAALQDFTRRLQLYLALRASLADKLQPLAPTTSGGDLARQQAALATGVRAARAGAKPGDLIPPAIAAQIRGTVLEDFRRRTAADERATFSEVPAAGRPGINTTYPADAALPTVPPLLLMNLPRLPDNLQYRFYGRDIVLLDGDLQIILDYVTDALPPH